MPFLMEYLVSGEREDDQNQVNIKCVVLLLMILIW